MKSILKVMGVLLILAGVVWAATILAGVAGHKEGFSTLTEMVPGLIFHVASLFCGMLFFGLGQKKAAPVHVKV